ncbi:MAG: glycosyltransferase [Candidatus Nanoarchaeia archaeon]|nr:glycosyltransferase [Candidatus Nanoarchaeia archaeon]MDD5358150.1 glycosyltransferase [Candidatus Nanoarchaeia archaeon]MDD5589337.1 glycosyltransferase [Candidatus Nanoarchaeia archaeon]
MISLIVTAYEDPHSTNEAINRLLNQKNFSEKFEIIAACPDEPTRKVIMDYKKKYPKIIKYVKQDNPDKNELMNKILNLAKGKILIWTDGNKFVEEDAISLIVAKFDDPLVGCVGGRPLPQNSRNDLFGFWAHLLTNAAHRLREKRFRSGKFVEQCANLLAIRKYIINKIPKDVAEDSIIPYLIVKKGYKNIYVGDAKVYVMYPRNFRDWVKQKVRSAKSHEAMNIYLSKKVKQKTLLNEFIYGFSFVLSFPKNSKELLWTLLLYPARLYVWLKAFYEIRIKKIPYVAVWSRSESTKTLDYKK